MCPVPGIHLTPLYGFVTSTDYLENVGVPSYADLQILTHFVIQNHNRSRRYHQRARHKNLQGLKLKLMVKHTEFPQF